MKKCHDLKTRKNIIKKNEVQLQAENIIEEKWSITPSRQEESPNSYQLSSLLIDKGVKTETSINNNVSEILTEFVPSFVPHKFPLSHLVCEIHEFPKQSRANHNHEHPGWIFNWFYWFPGPWTRVTSVVSLTTTAAAATAAMFPNPNF